MKLIFRSRRILAGMCTLKGVILKLLPFWTVSIQRVCVMRGVAVLVDDMVSSLLLSYLKGCCIRILPGVICHGGGVLSRLKALRMCTKFFCQCLAVVE